MRALKIIGKIIIYLVGYSVGFMCVVAMLGFAVVFAPLYLVRAKQKKAEKGKRLLAQPFCMEGELSMGLTNNYTFSS